jgi:hypothetical protein
MKHNKTFALAYRCAAFALCLAGILRVSGAGTVNFSPTIFLYYTTQSNILVLAMLGALIVKTASSLRKRDGGPSYFERLSAITALSISVTFVLYWALLAPIFPVSSLFSFANLQVHGITPLLMVFDYLFFAKRGKMRSRDPLLFAIVPYAYFIQSTVLGYSGVKYHAWGGASARFPYFFLDFDVSGAYVFAYVAAFTVFFLGLGYLLLRFDRRASGHKSVSLPPESR